MMFDMDTIFLYIGYAAGLATIIAFAIQTVRILRSKSVTGLSSYMYTMYCLSFICWFSYGIFLEEWVLAISMLIAFMFTFVILLLILYYDEEDKIEKYRRDTITCAYNKKYFEEIVPSKLTEAQIMKKPFSLIVTKLNNLEEFQKMGNKYYNRALKQTAKTLEKALRDSDIVARLENDKFAIYLDNSDEKIAKTVFKRVAESIQTVEIAKSNTEKQNLEILAGISSSKATVEFKELLSEAEEALSKASYKGVNKIKVYTTSKK